jgi:hypothetical protein
MQLEQPNASGERRAKRASVLAVSSSALFGHINPAHCKMYKCWRSLVALVKRFQDRTERFNAS